MTKRHKTPEYTKISTKAKKLEGKKHGTDFIDELFKSKDTRSQLNDEEYHEIKNEKKKESYVYESPNFTMIMLVGGIAVSSTAFLALLIIMVASKKERSRKDKNPETPDNFEQPKPKHSIISCFGLCSRRQDLEEDEEILIEKDAKGKSKGKGNKSKPYTGEARFHK
ncbi:hypothetical protein ACFFRR_006003, partial [Megaselia abdita]